MGEGRRDRRADRALLHHAELARSSRHRGFGCARGAASIPSPGAAPGQARSGSISPPCLGLSPGSGVEGSDSPRTPGHDHGPTPGGNSAGPAPCGTRPSPHIPGLHTSNQRVPRFVRSSGCTHWDTRCMAPSPLPGCSLRGRDDEAGTHGEPQQQPLGRQLAQCMPRWSVRAARDAVSMGAERPVRGCVSIRR